MMINTTRIGMPRGTPSQGFILIELLVSITIIIVLAAMVFVVTGKIRTNAQQTNALSSLRQIGIANLAYYTGNNGAINVPNRKAVFCFLDGHVEMLFPPIPERLFEYVGRMACISRRPPDARKILLPKRLSQQL